MPSEMYETMVSDLTERAEATEAKLARLREARVPCLLDCPECGQPHIDAAQPEKSWTNPPHRTHECQHCGHLWRPFEVATDGIENPLAAKLAEKDERIAELEKRLDDAGDVAARNIAYAADNGRLREALEGLCDAIEPCWLECETVLPAVIGGNTYRQTRARIGTARHALSNTSPNLYAEVVEAARKWRNAKPEPTGIEPWDETDALLDALAKLDGGSDD